MLNERNPADDQATGLEARPSIDELAPPIERFTMDDGGVILARTEIDELLGGDTLATVYVSPENAPAFEMPVYSATNNPELPLARVRQRLDDGGPLTSAQAWGRLGLMMGQYQSTIALGDGSWLRGALRLAGGGYLPGSVVR